MHTIRLIKPAQGSTTLPLQLHTWPNGHYPQGETIDRSQPRLVEFAWEYPDQSFKEAQFTLYLGQDKELTAPRRIEGLTEPFAKVKNLLIGTRYYWQVTAQSNGETIACSPTWSFHTHPEPPRWLHIPEITNVRDIGGWELPGYRRIRQGMVFRSSEMNSHLQLTPEGQRFLEQDLGIRTDIDLRGQGELCLPALDDSQVTHFNFPILPYAEIANEIFENDYRGIFRILADPQRYPLIIHCWGGADRTGTVVFLLQALLGMEKEALEKDYELTSLSIWGERQRTSNEFLGLLQTLAGYAPGGADLSAQAEGYLRSVGITDKEIQVIRQLLSEPVAIA